MLLAVRIWQSKPSYLAVLTIPLPDFAYTSALIAPYRYNHQDISGPLQLYSPQYQQKFALLSQVRSLLQLAMT